MGAVLAQNFQIIISLNFSENAPNIATQIRKRSTTGAPGVAGLGRNLGFDDLIILRARKSYPGGYQTKTDSPDEHSEMKFREGDEIL